MKRIELVVDQVVWHGGSGSRRELADALEHALVRELGNPMVQHALSRDAVIPAIDAGRVPRVTGGTVARALAGGIVNATRRQR